MPNRVLLLSQVALLALACTASVFSIAESDEIQTAQRVYEEVIVTARKREERLQDLPGSAAALGADFIEDIGGIGELRDLTDQIVGLTINETQGGTLTEPSMRGAGQARNRAAVSATGLYRNGAYFATNSLGGKNFARFDTYDVERVEVLRGAQGALYGRNALGGAINVITARPKFDDFDAHVGLKAGEKEMFAGDVWVNLPINDTVAARLAVVRSERNDGYFQFNNGDLMDPESYDAYRVALRWQPTEAIDINYVFDDESNEEIDAILAVVEHLPVTKSEYNTLIDSPMDTVSDVSNHNLTIDVDVAGGTFSSVSNIRDRDLYDIYDAEYYFPSLFFGFGFNRQTATQVDSESFFQEFRFVADGTDQFTWMIGADYFDQKTTEHVTNWAGVLDLPADVGVWGNAQNRIVTVDMDSWAAYASAEFTFDTLPLAVSAELRYSVDKVGGTVFGERLRLTEPQMDINEPKKEFKNTPWGITASYRFDDGLGDLISEAMVYAKVASAYRHGGLNLSSGIPDLDAYPVTLTYDEESSLTYELGFKSLIAGGLTFNFAGFITTYEDFLNTTQNGCPNLCQLADAAGNGLGFNPDGSRVELDGMGNPGEELPQAFFINNIGEAEAWGLEAEFTWSKSFSNGAFVNVRGGWSHQLGEVTKLDADVDPASAFAIGKDLPYMRPNAYKASVVYRHPLPGVANMASFLQGAALLTTANFVIEKGGVGTLPTPGLVASFQDDVERLDARVGIETEKWSLMLRGNNVLDSDHATWVYGPSLSDPSTLYRRVDPAYYSLEFAMRLR